MHLLESGNYKMKRKNTPAGTDEKTRDAIRLNRIPELWLVVMVGLMAS